MLTLEQIYSLNKDTFINEIRINCPECDDDNRHCYCNIKKMVYFCHKCGNKGRIVSEYIPDLARYNEYTKNMNKIIEVEVKQFKEDIKKVKSLPNSNKVNNFEGDQSLVYLREKAWSYLVSRGIPNHELEKYSIRYSRELDSKYSNSIIFPIYDTKVHSEHEQGHTTFYEDKVLKYFVCRKIDNSKPKYINAPWSKDDTLFVAGSYTASYAVIVEGIFDALAINRLSGSGWITDYTSIALLGKQATSQQLKKLVKRDDRYLIFLDNDALKFAVQLKMELDTLGCKTRIITADKDAADLYLSNKEELRGIILNGIEQLKKSKV